MDSDICKDRKWGFVAYEVPDPPKCISRCRTQFLEALAPTASSMSETLSRACRVLDKRSTQKQPQTPSQPHPPLWDLYCCDSQACGVNNVEGLGEDPNINWLINTCANIGFTSITDPGPPGPSYTCSRQVVFGDESRCRKQKSFPPSSEDNKDDRDPDLSSMDFIITTKALSSQDSTAVTSATETLRSIMSSAAHTTKATEDLNSDPDSQAASGDNGLSTAVKIGVSVSIVVGLFLIAAAVFCVVWRVRSRRISRRQQSEEKDHAPTQQYVRQTSTTSTLTPPMSPRSLGGRSLSPPLRLQDRRILTSSISTNGASDARSPTRASGFPQNPLYAPMRAKLVPRKEEMKTTYGSQATPLLSNFGWVKEDSSIKSGRSNGTGASSIHSHKDTPRSAASMHHVSRMRAFASPGPAPTKELPPTPTFGSLTTPGSPGFPSGPEAGHGNIGVAVGMVKKNPAIGVKLGESARELCEMTEAYHRKARDSGGSWSGNGGGGPGVAMGSPKKADRAASRNKALKEADLEDMGGKY